LAIACCRSTTAKLRARRWRVAASSKQGKDAVTHTGVVLTAAAIAGAVGGQLTSGSPDQAIDGFAIDSRTLMPGDLFFAIVAERDGHEFVDDAFARGAGAVVVERGRVKHPRGVVIDVDDTTQALQALGRHVRRASGATVIAITGSAGKTTTKETIAEFLSGRYEVVKNRGNLNNHLGLPLSLLELRHGADVAVMELGMNHIGEIRVLVGIAEPEVRVWTNVGDAHIGHFHSQDEIADAKGEILENASATDLLICNADDERVMARAARFAGRIVRFGMAAGADVRAEHVDDLGIDGMRVHVSTRAGSADMHVPLLGRGNLFNVLAAAAVATELGISLDDIARRADRLEPAHHRGAVKHLSKGITIVDDSYNSSPNALQQALDVITHERRATRKAAVLGEMLELGDHAAQLHEQCGRAAAAAGLARLITVGGEPAKLLAEAAITAGMDRASVTWVAASDAASEMITSWLAPGDLVLVKGSRGIKTDLVVDRIAAEFA
jgi:UDP-N-acetylmuramoyl-tripeptide--D-alanyl-D-alanine ligase